MTVDEPHVYRGSFRVRFGVADAAKKAEEILDAYATAHLPALRVSHRPVTFPPRLNQTWAAPW